MADPITVATVVGWGSSLAGFTTGALDAHRKVKEIISANRRPILLQEMKDRTEWNLSNKQRAELTKLYEALKLAAPTAKRLLRQSLSYALVRAALFALLWAILVTVLLLRQGATNGTLALAEAALSGVIPALVPRAIARTSVISAAKTQWSVTATTEAKKLLEAVTLAVGSGQPERTDQSLLAQVLQPLSAIERSFLHAYIVRRKLVDALEARILRDRLESARNAAFPIMQAHLQRLAVETLADLARTGKLPANDGSDDWSAKRESTIKAQFALVGLTEWLPKGSSSFWATDFASQADPDLATIVETYLGIKAA